MASDRPSPGFLLPIQCATLGLLGLALFYWPIVPHDTDLWYHLNFGRRTLATASIPDSAWYAYAKTDTGFVDYYWLAQVVFYTVHRAAGFTGLCALRAVLMVATAAAVAATAMRSELARRSRAWAAAVGVIAVLIVMERCATVRPHMFSYLALATCVGLVERGGRGVFALIPVALLWSNLHGIEYPVLTVVLGGAIAQALVTRSGEDRRTAVAAGLALICVLATPFGARLLPVPFRGLGLAGREIFELRPVSLAGLTTFGVHELVPSAEALRALLLAAALLSALDGVLRRRARVRHLLWLAAGAYLCVRAERFASEFALLALPAIGASTALARVRVPLGGRWPNRLAGAMFCALGVARVVQLTQTPGPYPAVETFLPKGTSAFLRAHAAQGSVLHHPNYGGYLQWTLGDGFRIGADMQTPFLFPIEQVLALSSAFADGAAMTAALQRMAPDFVFVPWNRWPALGPALAPSYAPIAFDDNAVLYAHRQQRAELVAGFDLRALPPARFFALLHDAVPEAELSAVGNELRRLVAADPRVAFTRAGLAVLERRAGHEALALQHARAAVALAPGHLEVLRVAGEIALGAHQWSDALGYYEAALRQLAQGSAPKEARSALALGAARALSELGRSSEVYAAVGAAFTDLTDATVSAEDLRLLSAAAADAGDSAAAKTLLALSAQRPR